MNNFNNRKKLPVLSEADIITADNSFRMYVEIRSGTYYFDNNWQYIIIENGFMVARYYYASPTITDTNPSNIFTFKRQNQKIYCYNNNVCDQILPDSVDSWIRISDFLSMLDYSGYNVIGSPVEFDFFVNPNFNNGHKNIRLVKGQIIKR